MKYGNTSPTWDFIALNQIMVAEIAFVAAV
jgi:hypothetical protein